MGGFLADQMLGDDDLKLLASAQRRDAEALRAVCRRFQTPLLAMAVKATGSLSAAARAVGPILESLLEDLLLGNLVATDWAIRAVQEIDRLEVPAAEPEAGQGLGGMEVIPRVARRRIVRDVLPRLPLAELTALLMKYLDHASPAEMVGIVADTPEEAERLLLQAHELVQQACDEKLAVGEGA